MAFGFGVLKLPPTSFWAMTPPELNAALRGHFGRGRLHRALDRGRLEELMAEHPDIISMEQT